MAKKKKSGRGAGLLVIVLIVGAMGFAALQLFNEADTALNERQMLEAGVKSARSSKQLTSKDEALLKLHLAIQDFRVKKGRLPNDLVELVPTYYDVLPKNPATKEAFVYERNANQYSILSGDEPIDVASYSGTLPTEGEIEIMITDGMFINPNDMPQEDYVYDPTGRRDPFRPFDLSGRTETVDENVPPLERYALSQLRVTAILVDADGDFTAMVQDAQGKGFTIKEGSRIGDKGGNVVSIEFDRVKVLEREIDFTGKISEKVQEMPLHNRTP